MRSYNQLLTSKETGKRKEKPEEDIALLDRVSEANAGAGKDYLEYLVLQRKSSSAELHTRLAVLYAERVTSFLEDETVLKLWRAKGTFPLLSSSRCTTHLKQKHSLILRVISTTTRNNVHILLCFHDPGLSTQTRPAQAHRRPRRIAPLRHASPQAAARRI